MDVDRRSAVEMKTKAWVGWVVGGIFYWSLMILMHGVGVFGGLVGWWDFLLVVGDFDARCWCFGWVGWLVGFFIGRC